MTMLAVWLGGAALVFGAFTAFEVRGWWREESDTPAWAWPYMAVIALSWPLILGAAIVIILAIVAGSCA